MVKQKKLTYKEDREPYVFIRQKTPEESQSRYNSLYWMINCEKITPPLNFNIRHSELEKKYGFRRVLDKIPTLVYHHFPSNCTIRISSYNDRDEIHIFGKNNMKVKKTLLNLISNLSIEDNRWLVKD